MTTGSEIAKLGILDILKEMKNPLTNIKLCIEMIEKQHEKTDGKDCEEIIKRNAQTLEDSVNDLIASIRQLGVTIKLNGNHEI